MRNLDRTLMPTFKVVPTARLIPGQSAEYAAPQSGTGGSETRQNAVYAY